MTPRQVRGRRADPAHGALTHDVAWRRALRFDQDPKPCAGAISLATYNCTSWHRDLSFLRTAPDNMRVVMIQEHHLMTDEAVRKAQAAASAAGWRVLCEPAIPSAGSAVSAAYNTGGVAIAVRPS